MSQVKDRPKRVAMSKHGQIARNIFAQNLAEVLDAKGWSQAEFARRLGRTRDAVSTYVNGRTFPNTETMAQILQVLGVPESRLMPQIESVLEVGAGKTTIDRFEIRIETDDPTMAHVILDRRLPTAVALSLAEFLKNNAPSD